MRKANIVLDMDGTLADFNGNGGLDRMYEEGFFRYLLPYPKAHFIIKRWHEQGHNIFILSACIDSEYCIPEKLEWLEIFYSFIPKENIHLVPVGTCKAEYFEKEVKGSMLDPHDVLFDDYKNNLEAWRFYGGTPVKCGKQYKEKRNMVQMIKWSLVN